MWSFCSFVSRNASLALDSQSVNVLCARIGELVTALFPTNGPICAPPLLSPGTEPGPESPAIASAFDLLSATAASSPEGAGTVAFLRGVLQSRHPLAPWTTERPDTPSLRIAARLTLLRGLAEAVERPRTGASGPHPLNDALTSLLDEFERTAAEDAEASCDIDGITPAGVFGIVSAAYRSTGMRLPASVSVLCLRLIASFATVVAALRPNAAFRGIEELTGLLPMMLASAASEREASEIVRVAAAVTLKLAVEGAPAAAVPRALYDPRGQGQGPAHAFDFVQLVTRGFMSPERCRGGKSWASVVAVACAFAGALEPAPLLRCAEEQLLEAVADEVTVSLTIDELLRCVRYLFVCITSLWSMGACPLSPHTCSLPLTPLPRLGRQLAVLALRRALATGELSAGAHARLLPAFFAGQGVDNSATYSLPIVKLVEESAVPSTIQALGDDSVSKIVH